MKRFIATAAVCGVSLFGFTAVAGAAGSPGSPSPNPTAIDQAGTACTAVETNNQATSMSFTPLGVSYLEDLGKVFCGN